jgi:hypothetical protein
MLTIHQQTTARRFIGLGAAIVALLAGGCEWSSGGAEATETELAVAQTATTAAADALPSAGWPAEINGPIQWLHTDVSGWAQTASLSASVGGGTINMPYSKARVWPAMDGLNANPWVIVNLNGQWYAATFEWFRFGQTAKPMSVLSGGGHIKVAPLSGWRPRSGERIGLMVSGLARTTMRNVKERSNVVMVTWP